MSFVNPIWTGVPDPSARDGWTIQWLNLTTANNEGVGVGSGDNVVGHADRSVQIEGTFGAGGNLVIEGTIDGVNYETLHDPSMTPLSFTGPGIKPILEAVLEIRPRLSGGDGTSSINVTMLLRKLR
jgi:hypothetical protein